MPNRPRIRRALVLPIVWLLLVSTTADDADAVAPGYCVFACHQQYVKCLGQMGWGPVAQVYCLAERSDCIGACVTFQVGLEIFSLAPGGGPGPETAFELFLADVAGVHAAPALPRPSPPLPRDGVPRRAIRKP